MRAEHRPKLESLTNADWQRYFKLVNSPEYLMGKGTHRQTRFLPKCPICETSLKRTGRKYKPAKMYGRNVIDKYFYGCANCNRVFTFQTDNKGQNPQLIKEHE
jgi:hypothetical protein